MPTTNTTNTTMKNKYNHEFNASMKPDGLHIKINGETRLIVENDPDDLVMRVPSDGYSHPAPLMFSIDDAIQELFGSLDRQQYLGLSTILSMVIFSGFEEQEKFLHTTAQ